MRLNPATLARHRRRNRLETAGLFLAILAWMAAVGWMVLDWWGLLWAAVAAGVMLLFQPVRSATLLRAMYGALPVTPSQAPGLYGLLAELCARAGIERVPPILHIPRGEVVALSTGWGNDAAIAVSDGLLRRLSSRELAAVLAHEVSHLHHGDLRILRLADAAGRLTRVVALVGIGLIMLYLPTAMMVGATAPLLALLLLVAAPVVSDLMTLRLSRSREFDADAGAAGLTGDPQGLIHALEHIDAIQGGGWERVIRLPGWRWLAWIRTHPTTAERIKRLAELLPAPAPAWIMLPEVLPLVGQGRRRGLWRF